MSIEELIKEASSKGYFLSNLFQRVDMQWQANFRCEKGPFSDVRDAGFPWGLGKSPQDALQMAIESAENQAADMRRYKAPNAPLIVRQVTNAQANVPEIRQKGKITIIRRIKS